MGADARQELLPKGSTTTGRRSAPRVRLSVPARIETIRGFYRVTLVNLSRTGAQIEIEDLPAIGSDVVLKCGTIDAFATVRWARGGRCGLHFDEPIDQTDVLLQRHAAEAAARSPKAAEWQAAREWAGGTG